MAERELVDVSPDDVVLHDSYGKPIIWREGKTDNHIRLIGGPLDGERHPYSGGVMVECMNPDKGKWGPTERLAYAYEIRGQELVAVFPGSEE